MSVREIDAKSILRKQKRIDSWFISRYGMNLYRGCVHNCSYCDGRAERYYVEGEFGRDVTVKKNALEILSTELSPKARRVPLKGGFLLLGGGVGDSYQPAEEKYLLSRGALKLFHSRGLPVHVLTKSCLVKRDVDLLNEIQKKSRAIVSFSFSSVDEKMSDLFEPGVPTPQERLNTLSCLKDRGLPCGMFLMPVIPFLTDDADHIEAAVCAAQNAGADFIIFGGMTLKEGRQKECFLELLRQRYPHLIPRYQSTYAANRWGQPAREYSDDLQRRFREITRNYGIPIRIPSGLFRDILDENDLATVILEHIDYLLRLDGKHSPFGTAARSLSIIHRQLPLIQPDLCEIKGVDGRARRIVEEILRTGTSTLYEQLLFAP